jgi:hypothetical protein
MRFYNEGDVGTLRKRCELLSDLLNHGTYYVKSFRPDHAELWHRWEEGYNINMEQLLDSQAVERVRLIVEWEISKAQKGQGNQGSIAA